MSEKRAEAKRVELDGKQEVKFARVYARESEYVKLFRKKENDERDNRFFPYNNDPSTINAGTVCVVCSRDEAISAYNVNRT